MNDDYLRKELTRLGTLIVTATGKQIKSIDVMSGGLTNINFKFILEDGFVVACRIPGPGTEEYVNRLAEKHNLSIMGILGISPEIYYYDKATGTMLSEFIHGETMHPEDFQNSKLLLAYAARVLKKCHTSGFEQADEFDPFRKIEDYNAILKSHGYIPEYDNTEELYHQLSRVEDAMLAAGFPKVPCHNDTLSENFMWTGNSMKLIDWEFSGMNDCYFDLAAFIVENGLSEECETVFLTAYCGNIPTEKDRARILLNKFLLDSFVFHWAMMQLDAGKDRSIYYPYGLERIERALSYTKDPAFDRALKLVAE